jgi:Mlc titration factor MtfA (ptsG expression regulator)
MTFEHEKTFIGAGGFQVTEEARVVVSAAAVRLVLFLEIGYLDRVNEIVIYPGAYQHPDRGGAILGEVSAWSTVVLSWEDVLAGLRNPQDGHDTAVHEFAHVLDRASGAFNGTPTLRAREDYAAWGRILSEHFLRLHTHGSKKSVLCDYAATNEAEFFAVATEVFFERPELMRRRAPDLYAELRRFYGFHPAGGPSEASG